MRLPTVSVVMPVYNGQRYLSRAVESILGQTWWDFELVAVNDGSTDETGRILERYAKGDGRVRVVWQENQGIVGALNAGLGAARGKLLARMDADDVALPGRLARQVDYLREHPECVAVGTEVLLIDSEGKPISKKPGIVTEHEEIDRALLVGGWPMVHPTVMMRASAVRKIRGYRPGTFPHEDHDLFLRLAEVGRLANIPEVLLKYRQHFGSVCVLASGRSERVRAGIIETTCRRRGIPVPPRPPVPREPVWQRHRTWAWWALSAGNVSTARKHALRSLRRAPLSVDNWRAMACAVRGY